MTNKKISLAECDGNLQTALLEIEKVGGGLVYVPGGTWTIPMEVQWPLGVPISLQGDGPELSILVSTIEGEATTAIRMKGNSEKTVISASVGNLTIRGTSNSSSTAHELITIEDYVFDLKLSNCHIKLAKHAGWRATPNSPGRGVKIEQCLFQDIGTREMKLHAGGAILGGYPDQIITDCEFRNCGHDTNHHAIYIGGYKNAVISRCRFSGRWTRVHVYTQEKIKGSIKISECIMDGQDNHVIEDCSDGIISNNLWVDSRMSIRHCTGLIIAGNHMIWQSDPAAAGGEAGTFILGLQEASDIFVTGNYFKSLNEKWNTTGVWLYGAICGDRWRIFNNQMLGLNRRVIAPSGKDHIIRDNPI